jgi:hypothetical protein
MAAPGPSSTIGWCRSRTSRRWWRPGATPLVRCSCFGGLRCHESPPRWLARLRRAQRALLTTAGVSITRSPVIILVGPTSWTDTGPANVAPAVPIRNVTSPGSTILSRVRPVNDRRSECTLNDTSADSPAAKPTRVKPIIWVTGHVTLATGSPAYSWTTSQILIAERGVGKAVPERECRSRVQAAYPLAVSPRGAAR